MKYTINDSTATDIANAIREKTGESGSIPGSSFATKIRSIQTGGSGPSFDNDLLAGLNFTKKKVLIAANFRQYYNTSGPVIGVAVQGKAFYEMDIDYAGDTTWHFGYTQTDAGWRWGWIADQSGGTVLGNWS